jgi:hypothetical protein
VRSRGKHPRPLAVAGIAAIALAVVGCGNSHTINQAACPTTKPGGPRPPRFALLNFGNPIASPSDPGWYGNGALWTELPAPAPSQAHGMLAMKMGWFRALTGQVTITGKPLYGPPASFSAGVGTPAEYGPTGFTISGIAFGRSGCWRLHASLAGRVLTVVLNVRPRRAGAA